MRVGVVSLNLSFFGPLERAFRDVGHKLVIPPPEEVASLHNARTFASRVDAVFGEFAQRPIERFIGLDTPLYVRTHRIEMYNELAGLDWSGCRAMWFSAQHVMDRYLERVKSPPQRCKVAPTNLVEPMIEGRSREAAKPYRMIMGGRWVPKKRLYTALQLMAPRLQDGTWELWLVGSNAGSAGYGNVEYPQNVADLIDALGVRKSVRVLGHLDGDAYWDALRACDAVMSMSNEEGTHVCVAEAMAAGCVPFVHAWRGASEIYPNTFLTFPEFDRLIEQWEALEDKQVEARGACEYIVGRGDPQEEAKKIVDEIHRDVHELRNRTARIAG